MSYRNFRVGPVKGLSLAALEDVPDLLVIVGPNGAGKSTLLYELFRQRSVQAESGTRVTYISANRPWRQSTITGASLFGLPQGFRHATEQDALPHFQVAPSGYYNAGQQRNAESADDVQSLIKYSIVRLEVKRRAFITATVDASSDRSIPVGKMPDFYEPLRNLVTTLLPHLRFSRVDTTDENNQRCIFTKLDTVTPVEIDIDDLSSGEKAAIALFLPFIESQIERLISVEENQNQSPKPVAIIDEPELHLHPALQTALVAYIRDLVRQEEAQFIIATQSPTLMDRFENDELYLLAPPSAVGEGNQLSKLSADSERLETVRQLTGATYVVTRMRPIVYLEGERAGTTRVISDQRIVELLVPETKGWVLVAAGGRSQAISAATQLREPSLTELPGLPVFALVDRDQADRTGPDHVVTWPVCMIENLLLDPVALWSLLAPQKELAGLSSLEDIDAVLRRYCQEMKDDEIRLRVRAIVSQPTLRLALESPEAVISLPQRAHDEAMEFAARIGGEQALANAVARAKDEVKIILSEGDELNRFRGKVILKRFFEEHAKRLGWGYATFCYQLAQQVAGTERLRNLVSKPVRRIRQFVPATLPTNLTTACTLLDGTADGTMATSTHLVVLAARKAWESSIEYAEDRAKIREQILAVARAVSRAGREDLQQSLLADLSQFSVG